MIELVLDASVLVKWYTTRQERGLDEALRFRAEYAAGRLAVVVPSLVFLELLNVAGRRWHLGERQLDRLASAMDRLALDVMEPELRRVAAWVSRGLSSYDAAYVALAEQLGLELVSDDAEILDVAARIARPLVP